MTIALAIAACSSGAPPDVDVTPAAAIVSGGPTTAEPYRLSIGDQLQVRFQFDTDLNDSITVGPDGHIVMQFIGDVPVAGLTIKQATALLNDMYAKTLREPNISVTIASYALQQIYVDGQVNAPGVVRSTTPLTVSRAIAQAGGLKLSSASTGNVLLVRRNMDGTVVYYQISLANGVPRPDQDPVLRTDDLVYVPEKSIASVADFVSNNLLRIIPFTTGVSATTTLK